MSRGKNIFNPDVMKTETKNVKKSCVINEVTYNVAGERYRNTIENHFANPYQDGLISAPYIQGAFTTDKNGLIAQIDQTYLP